MNRVRGRRYEGGPRKLNMKKVIATIIAFVVIVMIILSLKNLLGGDERNKDVSSLKTYISVLENNKWGVIDNNGNIVIDLVYDEMIIIPNRNEDVFVCTYDVDYNNEKYQTKILDENGKEILKQYENVEAIENNDGSTVWYEDNVLRYKKDGKFGLIDFEGNEILEPEYENIYALVGAENSLIIEKNGKNFILSSIDFYILCI